MYNHYFKKPLSRNDIVWSYSGVRPLCDDESDSPQAVTRDYTLDIQDEQGKAPLLSVFGGKLTTYRKMAEHVMEKLARYYPGCGPAWTKNITLPGGDIVGVRDIYSAKLCRECDWLPGSMASRYAHTYGSHSELILAAANSLGDLGEDFGHGMYQAELPYLIEKEWVVELDGAIWRRTKLGLWLDAAQQARVKTWLARYTKRLSLVY